MSNDARPEQSIASARASVMVYDDLNKKWVPSGTSHGLSKVHIYHHFINSTFRVVGKKLQDHEVVINCAILKNLKYNQATPTFHQWRDNKQVYGLNFSSKDDAEIFAAAMLKSLELLNTGGQLAVLATPPAPPVPPVQQPNNRQAQQYQQYPVYQQPHQHQTSTDCYEMFDEYNHSGNSSNHYGGSDSGYEIHQSQQQFQHEDVERRLSLQQQQLGMLHQVNSSPNMTQTPPTGANGISQGSPGHHRTSSAPSQPPVMIPRPPAPPPPPAPPMSVPVPPPPPPPMAGFTGGTAQPPLPPPLPNFSNTSSEPASGLAAELQAKIKKISQKATENSGGSTSSSGSSGYGTIGKGREERPAIGMASMMDEMQKTLARRRAKVDKADEKPNTSDPEARRGFEKSVSPGKSSGGSESPKPRRRFGSIADEIDITRLNCTTDGYVCTQADLETLRQDILKDIRVELNKMKLDIIEAFRVDMNRR